jgi:hypothetical protein
MKRIWGIIGLALFIMTATNAAGSGLLISELGDQGRVHCERAMLSWRQGVETLCMDAVFEGRGTNLFWIIPVPGEAKLESATSGLLPTLEFGLRPGYRAAISHTAYFWTPFVLYLGWAIHRFLKQRRWLALAVRVGVAVGTMLLVAPLCFIHVSSRFPSMPGYQGWRTNKVDSRMPVDTRVTMVKALDTNVWSTLFPDALGYTPEFRAALHTCFSYTNAASYVVCNMRLKASPSTLVRTPTVAFSFKTETPVYPLAGRNIHEPPLETLVYALADQRMTIPGYDLDYCS